MKHFGVFYSDSPQWESITVYAEDEEEARHMLEIMKEDIGDAEVNEMGKATNEMGKPIEKKVIFND